MTYGCMTGNFVIKSCVYIIIFWDMAHRKGIVLIM